MALEALYQRLPISLQDLACSALGWRIERQRYGRVFWESLQQAEQRSQWSHDRMVAYRDQRLHEFVLHAATTVPYYRELFRREGIDPKRIRSLDDLRELPILTKQEVQERGEQMVSEAVPPSKHLTNHTSGTTGGGLRFATTLEAIQEQFAIWWRYRRWFGISLGTWCAYFGGRGIVPLGQEKPPFWRFNRPGRQILFSGYHMSPANMPHYVAQLRRWKPPWLHGYPSLLALLASHLLDSDDGLDYQPAHVTIGAENLLPHQAALMERAFGQAPRQHYGLSEAAANISQWPDGKLRIDEDFAAVELLPVNEDPGQYHVVGTNFTNLVTPLLRYDTQDLVTLSGAPPAKDHPGRIVQQIDGRHEDYVILPNGSKVGRMDHVFKDQVNVREAQIIQREIGSVIVHVVRGRAYSEQDEGLLINAMQERIGKDTTIHIEYADVLERGKTGKLRFVISELGEGRLAPSSDPES